MTRLSLTGKIWNDPLLPFEDDVSAMMGALLQSRDLSEEKRGWSDPSLYPQAAAAAERVRRAVQKGEKIGIVGDYDCDGLTSSALLVRLFRRLGSDPVVRLPHRLTEGYGVQELHVREMQAAGVTLLCTVDTGIAATEALALAKREGIDVIVLDHHAYAELPEAFAILHPNLAREPIVMPAAAGIALTFAHAFGANWDDRDTDLALGMIGTIADVVPLRGENRTLVQDGLAALHRLQAPSPLALLKERCGIRGRASSTDVAFRIAPRLNAAGRLGDPTIGLSALLGNLDHLEQLEMLNTERQLHTQRCLEDVLTSLDEGALPPVITMASEGYPKGIVGLLAGKLTERFGRPALVGSTTGGLCTASLRSIPAYHITDALRRHAELFISFGGHSQAAGCTFRMERFDDVRSALLLDIATHLPMHTFRPAIDIDAHATLAYARPDIAALLQTLEPFGAGNREPLFLFENVLLESLRCVGNEQQHLQARAGGVQMIGFHLGHVRDRLTTPVDVVARMAMNEWNGRAQVQLSVVDIRESAAILAAA